MAEGGVGERAWGDGLRELRERLASIPDALRATAQAADPEVGFDPRFVQRIVVTGIGSSGGQARFLARLLSQDLGLAAQFVSTGSLAVERPGSHAADVLIVFSQGLSPNARFALGGSDAWAERILVTAIGQGERSDPEPSHQEAFLDAMQDAGVRVIPLAAPRENGMLVRVLGPMLGYLVALRLTSAIARAGELGETYAALDVETICTGIAASEATLDTKLGGCQPLANLLGSGLVLLASGGYGEALQNLRTKVLEGMGLPFPPLWDLLEFAHGGFQKFVSGPGTAIALTRAGAPWEGDWMSRARGMLDAGLHEWLEFPASFPWPYSVFEHEAYFNGLLVRWLEERSRDPRDWPGRGRDGPLYNLAPPLPAGGVSVVPGPGRVPRAFEQMSWPEVGALVARTGSVAVIPLGSTEQHGPHLPLATDTWIADALAEGFCARVPGAVRLPALALGCAEEHLGFPGTLSLRPEHLRGVLCDVLSSLHHQGFERAFLFSAHGGNAGPLRAMADDLHGASGRLQLILFDEWDELVEEIHALARESGVSSEAAGHHAGEFETSILRLIAPAAVREEEIEPGLRIPTRGAEKVFYPSLRKNAPSGVVGDARGADAERGRRYLECWVEKMVRAYRAQVEGGAAGS
ncbi:MAG: creatininase family protein [Myxococcota bacterium]